MIQGFSEGEKLKKVIVVSQTLPKYSEPWMSRMTHFLAPDVIFIALEGDEVGESSFQGIKSYVLSRQMGPIKRRIKSYFGKSIVQKKIEKVIDKFRGEDEKVLVVCHYLTTALTLSSLLGDRRIDFFVHCHGHDVTWARRVEAFPILPAHGLFYAKRVKRLIGLVKVIANSEATLRKLLEVGFPKSDVFIKYLGVDIESISPNDVREKDSLNVLYLGRFTDFKGPIETIKAFELARSMGFKGCLTMVGGGNLLKKCRALVKSSGFRDDIKITGPLASSVALEYFKNTDIFTAHNKRSKRTGQEEAFGVSIVEAMAHQIPIVTGASGGVKETVVNGKNGVLFEPGDIEAHAQSFLLLQNNEQLRRSMSKNSRELAKTKFDSRLEKGRLLEILGI